MAGYWVSSFFLFLYVFLWSKIESKLTKKPKKEHTNIPPSPFNKLTLNCAPQTLVQPIQVCAEWDLVRYQQLHNNFLLEFEAVH